MRFIRRQGEQNREAMLRKLPLPPIEEVRRRVIEEMACVQGLCKPASDNAAKRLPLPDVLPVRRKQTTVFTRQGSQVRTLHRPPEESST